MANNNQNADQEQPPKIHLNGTENRCVRSPAKSAPRPARSSAMPIPKVLRMMRTLLRRKRPRLAETLGDAHVG